MHFGGQNLNPATFKYTWKGDWKPHVVYMRHDVVRHRGRTWYSKSDEGANERYQGYYYEPGKSTFWENHTNGNVNRGGWSPQRTYHKGDMCNYKGDWYVCVTGGRGIHPVYDHGALTNKWTRVTKAPRMSNPGKFVPIIANQAPLGWDRYYGSDAPMQQGNGGCHLIDWDGNPCIIGGPCAGTTYLGAGNKSAAGYNRRPSIVGQPWTDFLEHNKQPITGQNEIIQIAMSTRGAWYLANNGEVFFHGHNQNYAGVGDNTTRQYGTATVGKDNSASTGTNWNTPIVSGTFRDSFIIKLATDSFGIDHTVDLNCIALDSDGQVWTWGISTYGATGWGHPETGTGSAFDTATGIPFKLDYNTWFGGSPIKDIWTFKVSGMTLGRQGCFAIDNNEMLWSWGDNTQGFLGHGDDLIRRPAPVFDCSKYGGLKKLTSSGGSYPITILLMMDGSLHFAGSRSARSPGEIFTGGVVANEDGNDRAPGFQSVEQMWYNTYKRQYSSVAAMADVFTDIQNIWLTENYSTFLGNVCWQNYDRDIFVTGDGTAGVPITNSFAQGETNRHANNSRFNTTASTFTFPMLTDWTSLNGQVEYLQWWGGYDETTSSEIGCSVMSEDGRTKHGGGAYTSSDNSGLGISEGSSGSSTHDAYETGLKQLFADEAGIGNITYGAPTSQHFGPMSQKATHMGGIRGATKSTGAYVTFYEDGTAGFFGRTTDSITNNESVKSNWSGTTAAASRPQQGRIRAM